MELEITPQELQVRLQGASPPHLLDVRQPEEFALNQLPDAQLLPLGELATRLDDVPEQAEVVCYCHHGMRSLQAAGFLVAKGRKALSLKGGIDAWSRLVDPAVPRY